MIDIPFAIFLALLALMFGFVVLLDFRRRRRVSRDRRESDLREAIREMIGDRPQDRSST